MKSLGHQAVTSRRGTIEFIIFFIIIAIILFIGGIMLTGAFGIGWIATSERREKRQAAEAAQRFVEKFDGDARVVTYEYSSLRARPTKEEIIEAADTFDYRLISSSESRYGATLVFEKREP